MEAAIKNVEFDLEEVIKNDELKVFYQPQYDALTNKIVSAEALARWIKPDGTVVPPIAFIPQLEASGKIVGLDWHVLEKVCRFQKRQKDDGLHLFPVAVNFSRLHADETDFVKKLCDAVDRYGLPHKIIEVEITESAFVELSEQSIEIVRDIRNAGFRVAIDDFGYGLSSLSFIKDVSADILKIDKSLLSHNCEDEKERIVLESIFDFAHRLKLTTIAEGVETREQLGFLRTCSCNMIQGFLFAKPMPEDDFERLCRSDEESEEMEDILLIQAPSSATKLLLDAVFTRYPLIIFSNLTKNSYYMMAYENFTAKSCASAGIFTDLIAGGAQTMHPDDRESFLHTFSIENQMAAHERGDKVVTLVTRQMGDDGIYRRVETANYFVKNPSSDDVLVISLCHNLE